MTLVRHLWEIPWAWAEAMLLLGPLVVLGRRDRDLVAQEMYRLELAEARYEQERAAETMQLASLPSAPWVGLGTQGPPRSVDLPQMEWEPSYWGVP